MSIFNTGLLKKVENNLTQSWVIKQGYTRTGSDETVDGVTWDAYVDSNTFVYSSYIDVKDYNFLIMTTRGRTSVSEFIADGYYGDTDSLTGIVRLDLYSDNGDSLINIPSTYDSAEKYVIIDVRGVNVLRFGYKDSQAHVDGGFVSNVRFNLFGLKEDLLIENNLKSKIVDVDQSIKSLQNHLNPEWIVKEGFSSTGSNETIDGVTWDAFVDSDTFVYSSYFNVKDYNFLTIATRTTRTLIDFVAEGVSGDNTSAVGRGVLDIYQQNGEKLTKIPESTHDTAYRYAIIDVRGIKDFRFGYKDTAGHAAGFSTGVRYNLFGVQENIILDSKIGLKIDFTNNKIDDLIFSNESVESLIVDSDLNNIAHPSNFIYGERITDGSTGERETSSEGVWTGFLKVKPNTKYIRNVTRTENFESFFAVHFYGFTSTGNIENIGSSSGDNREFITPENCQLIGMNVKWNDVIYLPTNHFAIYEVEGDGDELFNEIQSNENARICEYLSGYVQPYPFGTLRAVYENHFITAGGDYLRYGDGGIEKIDQIGDQFFLNDTNFPNIVADSGIDRVVLFNTSEGVRTLLITNKNQVYYSDGQTFGNFKESNIWTLEGEEYKHPDLTDLTKNDNRYKLHIANTLSGRSRQFAYMNGNEWGQEFGFIFGNYANNLTPDKAVADCLFSTSNGKDIYVHYMFGINGRRVKKAGTTDYITRPARYGDLVDTSTFASYSGGLTIKTRTNIIPSSAELEPVNKFEFGIQINVTGFTGSVATVSDATGIEIGDVVLFEGDASNADWNSMRNLTATTNDGGNGRFYMVKDKSGNDLTIAHAIGNPNNNLTCRHIHSVNKAANGLIIGTGEEYPESWFIHTLYSGSPTSPRWKEQYRINSSENGIQRPLGCYLRSDGKFIYGSDTPDVRITAQSQITGRTEGLKFESSGCWIGELSDVDDWSKFKNKLWDVSLCYHFKNIGGALLFLDVDHHAYLSYDEGDNWSYLGNLGTPVKQVLLGFDKKRKRYFYGATFGSPYPLFIELKK